MSKPTVLVTGGAGYIGSHAVLALKDAGLSRITVSLDSLTEATFHRIIGADVPVQTVLEGIAKQYADNKITPIALYQIAVIYYEKKDWAHMAEALETLIQTCPQSEQVTDGFF